MTYNQVADMAEDYALTRRITAAAGKEGLIPPDEWAGLHRWEMATQPGWEQAWASAVAGGVENPGADEGVITDAMILSAVQAVAAS